MIMMTLSLCQFPSQWGISEINMVLDILDQQLPLSIVARHFRLTSHMHRAVGVMMRRIQKMNSKVWVFQNQYQCLFKKLSPKCILKRQVLIRTKMLNDLIIILQLRKMMNLLTDLIVKRKKIIKSNNQESLHLPLKVLLMVILVQIRKRWKKWRHNWSWWKSIRFHWWKEIRKKMINLYQSPQFLNPQQRIMNHLHFPRLLQHPWILLLF